MAEGASAVSPDGRIIFCNPRLAEFLQMSCESLLGGALADFVAVEDRVRFAELMEQAKAGPVRGRIGIVGAAGRALPVQVSASPLHQPDGTAVCIVATDLTEVEDAVRRLERVRLDHEVLRDSTQRLRDSLAGAAVGLAITTLDGRFAEVNPTFCRIVGYSADELQGLTYRQVIHPDNLAENTRLAERMEAGETDSFVAENRYIRKDGRPVWVRKSVSPVRDLSGAVQGRIAFVEDISEKKQAEQALRESEERFRSVLDNSCDVIVRLNIPKGRFEYVSPSCESLVGYTVEELMAMTGRQTLAMVHPHDLPVLRKAIDRSEAEGQADAEYRQRRKDGSYVWVLNRMSVTMDGAGRPLYRLLSLRDITESKRAEDALRRSNTFNQSIIDSSRDCIKILDLDGRLTYMSAGGQRLLGIKDMSAYLNVPYEEFWKGSDRKAVSEAMKKAKQGQSGSFQGFCPTADGIPKWWDVSVSPVLGADGRPERLLAVSRDITGRKLAEEQSASQLAELTRWQAVMLDREERNMQLKREVNELLRRLGEPIRYPSQAKENSEQG